MKTRRGFLRNLGAAGLAAPAIVAGLTHAGRAAAPSAASAAHIFGANERLRVALIGCGGMGQKDLRNFLSVNNVECVALCDVDDNQAAKTRQWVEADFASRPTVTTRDFRRVLEVKDIDAVIVATPDHWHALPTVQACQAGKDVYVEKPLALSIAEGRVMVETARRHNRVVQMGTQQRSQVHFKEAVEYVKSGQLGQVRMVRAWAYQNWMGNVAKAPDGEPPAGVDYEMWLGPAPKRAFNRNRFHFNFRWYYDYSGGLMTDWGAHMIDIANWAMGVKAPSNAMSGGGKFGFPDDAEETPDTQQAIWNFPTFSLIWEHATAIGRGPEQRDHGVAFHGNNGMLVVDRGGWEVYPESERGKHKKDVYRAAGVPRQPLARGEDGHFEHAKNFLECVKSRQRPNSDVEIGHNSMIACHLGNIAFRTGRVVHWDVEHERVIGDAEAQKLVGREYRAPWRLPEAVSKL